MVSIRSAKLVKINFAQCINHTSLSTDYELIST